MANVTGELLSMMSAQAGIDDTRAQTQQRMQAVEMNKRAMQRQDNIDFMLQQRAARDADGTPKKDTPDMVTLADGTMVPTSANNPLMQVVKSALQNVDRAKQNARDANYMGDWKDVAAAEKEVAAQQKEVRLAQAELYKDMENRTKQASQALGGVRSFDDLQSALQYINDNIGPGEAKKIAQQIDKAIPDITKATPEELRAAIAPINNRFATMGDQLRKEASDQASKDRAASLEETKKRDRDATADRKSNIAINREKLNLMNRKFDAAGVPNQKQIFKEENDAQNALNKDKSLDNFYKMKKGYESAKGVADVLEKNGFRSVTPVEANTLMTEYTQMANNYRSLVGGKWTETQRKRFDSIFDKTEGFIKSIGKGYQYSPEALKDVTAEMNRMYQDTNKEVVKKTLLARDRVWRRGGDPTVINSPGSIEQTLRQPGVDQVVDPETGTKIIRFGEDPEDWYVVRDKPKPRPKVDAYEFEE
jgi:hypothetical protein